MLILQLPLLVVSTLLVFLPGCFLTLLVLLLFFLVLCWVSWGELFYQGVKLLDDSVLRSASFSDGCPERQELLPGYHAVRVFIDGLEKLVRLVKFSFSVLELIDDLVPFKQLVPIRIEYGEELVEFVEEALRHDDWRSSSWIWLWPTLFLAHYNNERYI